MKFKFKTARIGEERTVKKFLWLPKWINNECRWLETATWVERTIIDCSVIISSSFGWSPISSKTANFKWIGVKWI